MVDEPLVPGVALGATLMYAKNRLDQILNKVYECDDLDCTDPKKFRAPNDHKDDQKRTIPSQSAADKITESFPGLDLKFNELSAAAKPIRSSIVKEVYPGHDKSNFDENYSVNEVLQDQKEKLLVISSSKTM